MRLSLLRHLVPFALFASIATVGSVGCSAPEGEEVEAGDDALAQLAGPLENEVRLLGGSSDDVRALITTLEQRIADLDAKKDGAKDQAEKDVASYNESQWSRSFFTKDEMELAIDARARDIFDRPERRALDGAKAQLELTKELVQLLDAKLAGPDVYEPSPRAAYIREGYVEIGVSIAMNAKYGIGPQIGAQIGHLLREKFPWLGKIFKGMRRQKRVEGIEGEAVNIDRSGAEADLWKKDPINSTAWHPRKAEEITPARLYHGPWYAAGKAPRLPQPNEIWKLSGFRSQAADGANSSVKVSYEGNEVQVKFSRLAGQYTQGQNARLLWAMGYETDPQYTLQVMRMEPRAFIASQTASNRIGIKFGDKEDEIVPARPPRGFSFPLNGMKRAPGAEGLTIHYKDGRDQAGDVAIEFLRKAIDDRPLMDSMEYVDVLGPNLEIDNPIKRDAVGPWDYDAENHVDDREIRAIGIVFGAWLGSFDSKFNNVRLDVQQGANGVEFVHTLSDTGGLIRNFDFKVGIDPKGKFLHPDTNKYTIAAFDRLTTNDAKWAVARIAALSEEQILAAFATGAFNDGALALHVEKLVSRRDDLIKTFGLENEFPLMRPNGPNTNPPPRHYDPPADY